MSARPDDEGTVLVLVLGFAVVLLALVVVVVDVTAVLLARRAVGGVADGAAIAAAQQLDEQVLYAEGLDGRVPLSPGLVAGTVAQYEVLARTAQPDIDLVGTVQDGTVAVVRARRVVPLPLSGWLPVGAVTVEAVARARSPLAP